MTRLIYKTKDGSDNIRDKTRVYFSCHREDFETVFEPVCKDIFVNCDCVIYYREDMSDSLDPETHDLDLGLMNLFVFAVTRKTLEKGDSEVLRDLEFAKASITSDTSILPIVFESEIDREFCALYEKEEFFGHIQFLSKLSGDLTEIEYGKKLGDFFNSSQFINDEERSAIHGAFEKRIFLSYRKKDRKFANELIQLIHSAPDCRYIAVWYDEFLSAGENYDDQIKASMEKSDLVVLLVTPNLLEEGNFVMETEYPDACGMGKRILPVEIVPLFGEPTDRAELYSKYKGLPEVLSVDDANFKEALREGLKDLINPEQEYDSDRDYLVGLAYLEGIDVEKNPSYAIELIERAAKAGNTKANLFRALINSNRSKGYNCFKQISKTGSNISRRLYKETIYLLSNEGVSFARSAFGEDYFRSMREMSQRTKDILLFFRGYIGEADIKYLDGLYALGIISYHSEQYEEALRTLELCYYFRRMVLGKEKTDSLDALSLLAKTYRRLHDIEKARKCFEECHKARCRTLGEEHKDTIAALYDLAVTYYFLGEHEKTIETYERCYQAQCRTLGEEHEDTRYTLEELIMLYHETGDEKKELELKKKQYEVLCKLHGKESPEAKKAHKEYMFDKFLSTIPGKIFAIIFTIIYLPIKAVIGLFKKLFGGKNGNDTK